MLTRCFVVILLGLVLVQPCSLQDFSPSPEQIREWSTGLVLLNHNNQAQCTGWFVSRDGIIACPYHLLQGWVVTADEFPIIAVTRDKQVHRALLLAYDSQCDLMFLKIDYKAPFWFDKFTTVREFDRCFVLGFPHGWEAGFDRRIIRHFQFDLMGVNLVPIEGASGSVVLSLDGKVLGMLTHKFGLSVVIPSLVIERRLKKLYEAVSK